MSLVGHDAAFAALNPAPFHLPVRGLDAVVEGAIAGLRRGDWWVPGLRERVGAALRDVPLTKLVDPAMGARQYKVAPAEPTANRALYAVGLAMASPDCATLVHLGIASTAAGAFHEALNVAALRRPNVIFLVAVDPLGPGAPLPKQLATTPSRLAEAFGIPTTTVNGRSQEAVRDAVIAARTAGGPHLIQADLLTL